MTAFSEVIRYILYEGLANGEKLERRIMTINNN
jgi:hypothetical protein